MGAARIITDEPLTTGNVHTTLTWRTTLDRGVGRWRLTALRRLAADVAGTQERCQRLIPAGISTLAGASTPGDTSAPGSTRLPDELGRQLRTLSVRLTTDLDAGYRVVAERTLSAALGHRPGPQLGQRVADEVRGICAARTAEILLVTPSGGVTAARGTRALAGYYAEMASSGNEVASSGNEVAGSGAQVAGGGTEPVVRPVEVALDPACQVLWRNPAGVHPVEVRLWLQRALDSVAARLLTEVVGRCQDVHGALAQTLAELKTTQFQYPQREPQVEA